ncbi:MAG: YciI family protein [Solirubrobacteraceae bacterium]|jgi:hypothetical protein
MKYAMLIYMAPEAGDAGTAAERESISQEYYAIAGDPRCVGGEQLAPVDTATTVRVAGGETLLTDGPFATTKEVLGGFYLFDADDMDAALEIAAKIPSARLGGSVEVRPLVERAS